MSYVLRRLASGVLLILALTLLTYVVFFTIPTNPACLAINCGPGNTTTPAQLHAAEHALGLDRPVLVQYGSFLWNVVRHGSLGESFTQQYSIGSVLKTAVPATAAIVFGGAVLLLLLALPLGMLSALRANRLLDRGVLAFSLVGIALHPFVVGLLLQQFLADRWGLVPHGGYCPIFGHASTGSLGGATSCGGLADWASHLYLPWIVFALFFLPLYTRMFRARLIDTLGEEYVRTARAKGASEARVLSRHVFRNSVLPILPMLAMDVGTAVTTAIYVETIFGIGGLGRFAVSALSGNAGGYDLPAIVAIVFVVACGVVFLNLLADLALVALDPRITGRSGSQGVLRTPEGGIDRRRLALSVAVAALAVGGIAAAATVPRGGSSGGSVAAYTKGARTVPAHWTDHVRLFWGYLTVDVERIAVGPDGWAVTARVTNLAGEDLTVTRGGGTYPPQAGCSLQFVQTTKVGGHTFTALPAYAYDPSLPATLPVGGVWEGTFAGPGAPPRDGTLISIGLGRFASVVERPTTVVTNTSFKLH